MYYGKGAGKLPTASAVCADVIDGARHVGKNVPCYWENKEAALAPFSESSHSFYIRVKADAASELEKLVPGGTFLTAEVAGQKAYITPVITEKKYYETAAQLGDAVLSRVRVYQ